MTKQQKINYINTTFLRFADACNHGSGGNWWYPTANRMAYNVKMHAYFDIDKLKEKMSDRQKEYYSDDTVYEIAQENQVDSANSFAEDLYETYEVTSNYAGRSGGWLEIDYTVNFEEVDTDTDTSTINDYYKKAKELEQLESTISEHIKKSHADYNIYMKSDEYYNDMLETLLTDDDIADIYKSKIEHFANKLK